MKYKTNYKKHCEFCDEQYTSTRKHSRTCSPGCRHKLFKNGFSNKKIMELVVIFPSIKEASVWLKKASPIHYYNYCTEASGLCYIYKYKSDYVLANKERFKNTKRFSK